MTPTDKPSQGTPRELVTEWRKRADEVGELFGSERIGVFVHGEVLRMCANELEAAQQPTASEPLATEQEIGIERDDENNQHWVPAASEQETDERKKI